RSIILQRSEQNGRQGFAGSHTTGVPHCGQFTTFMELAGLGATILGEGRLRRETVEGFPVFVERRGPHRRRAARPYSEQKVSSNSTSVSAAFGRCMPSCVVKRMLRAYLFALI